MRAIRVLLVAIAGAVLFGAFASPAIATTNHNLAKADRILARLIAPGGLAHYKFPTGTIATATVCVRNSCASETVSTPPPCTTPPCIDPALFAHRYRDGVTIEVEVY